jgi:hypothetical protein
LIILIANIHPCLHEHQAACGGYQQVTKTFSNNRFDKKDQLLEINPMALRLSGQSWCKGFNERPMRRHCSVHGPKGLH